MVTAQERIGPGAVTGRCNNRCNSETALLRRVFPTVFIRNWAFAGAGYPRAGIQVGIHANQGFPIGTHGPGTQAGTQGKPCFAGAENLSKPDFQNLKKPETQDAAKPNKTLHTLVPQGFVKLSLRSA